jgi:CheY-like chemotaxis protein
MDVQMPVMDGLTATCLVRCELCLKDLPIIAVTAGVLPEQREQAREAGFNDFVTKPVDLEELVAVLIRWTSEAPLTTPSVVAESPTEFPAIPGLDLKNAAVSFDQDREFFLSLLHDFVAEFGQTGQRVQSAIQKEDRDGAARLLHAMRGAAGYIGAVELVSKANMLETSLLDKTSDMSAQIDGFSLEFATLINAISTAISGH